MNNQLIAPAYGAALPLYNAPYYGSAWNNNLMYNDYSRYDARVMSTDYTRYGARYNSLAAPIQTYGYGAPVIRAPLYNAPYYGSAWNNNMLVNDFSSYDTRVMNNGIDARVLNTPYNTLVAPVQSYGYGAAPIVRSSWNTAPIIGTSLYGNDIVHDNSYAKAY
jgi:hypothetical protein